MKSARFWVVLCLLALAALLLHRRGDVDKVAPSQPLSGLPETIGPWSGTEIPLNPLVLDVLGKGSFLNRVYLSSAPGLPAADLPAALPTSPLENKRVVTLFIAYFPTQRTGQAIHSPQNCLPGAGWTFESKGLANLTGPQGKRIQVGEYVISDGRSRQEVLYWYRSHGRSIASDYLAKLYTLLDSIRYNRTDAALIRVITPLAAGEDQNAAHQRAVSFAEQMAPLLPAYIPD
jgi:EpsI family protein